MSKSAMTIATELTEAAERARTAGDVAASLTLAFRAAEYLQLAKILGDAIANTAPNSRQERP